MARRVATDVEDEAAIFDALAHPFRVAIRNELRNESPLAVAELRRRVSANYHEIDTRNIQFHLYRMQVGGVVKIEKKDGRDSASLEKDVSITLR